MSGTFGAGSYRPDALLVTKAIMSKDFEETLTVQSPLVGSSVLPQFSGIKISF